MISLLVAVGTQQGRKEELNASFERFQGKGHRVKKENELTIVLSCRISKLSNTRFPSYLVTFFGTSLQNPYMAVFKMILTIQIKLIAFV